MNESKPKVSGEVKVIPTKRTATFDVPLDGAAHFSKHKLSAAVNTKSITFGASSDIPKTLEAIDAIIALAHAVRAELVEQGVES